MKFGRHYNLLVQHAANESFTISDPLRLDFDISRNNFSEANYASLRIYNLSLHHRSQLQLDITNLYNPIFLTLTAGYGDNSAEWPIIFTGNVSEGWSKRQGTAMITEMQCFDGGIGLAAAYSAFPVSAGVPWDSVVATAAATLSPYGIGIGAQGSIAGEVVKGFGVSGWTKDVLTSLTNGNWFIDNGQLCVLSQGQALGLPTLQISAATGLLGVPQRRQNIVDLDVIFEPSVRIGQLVYVDSAESQFSGTFQVIGISHRGTISGATSGAVTTRLRLMSSQPGGSWQTINFGAKS